MVDLGWFGVNAQIPRQNTVEFPYPAESDIPYARMEAAWNRLVHDGIHWVRVGQWGDRTSWDNVERQKGVLRLDPEVKGHFRAAHDAGMGINLTLAYGNALYCGPGVRPTQPVPNQWEGPRSVFYAPLTPEAVGAFGRYCRFVAEQLKGLVSVWEIWNEENIGREHGGYFWAPVPDAAAYVRLLRVAACAIREVDPDTPIMFGGLAGIDQPFLRQCLELGAAEWVDSIGFHPYRPSGIPEGPRGRWDPYPDYDTEIRALRALVNGLGGGRIELDCNELGWAVAAERPEADRPAPDLFRQPVTEVVQAKYLARAYLQNLAMGIRTAWWWLLNAERDGVWGTQAAPDEGLLTLNGEPRLAYTVLARLCQAVSPKAEAHRSPIRFQVERATAPLRAVETETDQSPTLWLWNPGPSHQTTVPDVSVHVRVPAHTVWEVWDSITGGIRSVQANESGDLSVIVPDYPIGIRKPAFQAR